MLTRWARRRSRRGEDRGAVAVEAALITPLLLLLVFGIIEFSFAFKDDLAVSAAVRAGARAGSAEPGQPSFATDTAAAVARAGGALNLSSATLYVYDAGGGGPTDPVQTFNSSNAGFCGGVQNACNEYTWNASTSSFQLASPENFTIKNISNCPNAYKQNAIGVYMSYRHDFLTGFLPFGKSVTLSDNAVVSFEPVPNVAPC